MTKRRPQFVKLIQIALNKLWVTRDNVIIISLSHNMVRICLKIWFDLKKEMPQISYKPF